VQLKKRLERIAGALAQASDKSEFLLSPFVLSVFFPKVVSYCFPSCCELFFPTPPANPIQVRAAVFEPFM
jgi:hypothetical protein